MVNTHLIKLQGQRLQDMLNSSLPPDQQLALQFSNGWLEKFCHRHSFKQQVVHGESGSVQQEVINQELPALRQLLQQYHPDDIFNADETGLFYNMPPNKTGSHLHWTCTAALCLHKSKARTAWGPLFQQYQSLDDQLHFFYLVDFFGSALPSSKHNLKDPAFRCWYNCSLQEKLQGKTVSNGTFGVRTW